MPMLIVEMSATAISTPAGTGDEGESPSECEEPSVSAPGSEVHSRRLRADLVARMGRYLMLREIARGGMGSVHEAYDAEADRRVAIKIAHFGTPTSADGSLRSSTDESTTRARALERSRLVREAQVLARLTHPNIVSVFDVGTHGEDGFIVMELAKGQSLRTWSKSRTRTQRECLEACIQVGRGLAAAHRQGILHRDVKPDNVIVRDDGRVQIVDFGLARASPVDGATAAMGATSIRRSTGHGGPTFIASNATCTGDVLGTPAYMSPEQHKGAIVDESSDLYSYCVMVFELLYGQRPFQGPSRHGWLMQPATLASTTLLPQRSMPDFAVKPCVYSADSNRLERCSRMLASSSRVNGSIGPPRCCPSISSSPACISISGTTTAPRPGSTGPFRGTTQALVPITRSSPSCGSSTPASMPRAVTGRRFDAIWIDPGPASIPVSAIPLSSPGR